VSKIYIVTSGSYSDYSIDEVFAHKADAERYAATTTDSDVEEYELHESLPAERVTVYRMIATVTRAGASSPYEAEYQAFPGIGAPRQGRPKVTFTGRPADPRSANLNVEGFDRGQVLQAFSDAVAAKVAELEMTTA
jgi:hypothetical protein